MKRLALILVPVLLLVLIIRPYWSLLTQTFSISPVGLLFSQPPNLKKTNDTIGLVFLGISGGNHDGATLSDSILAVQYDLVKNHIVVVSVPRDVWSDTLKDKINSAYAYGEDKKKGGGIVLAKAEVSSIVGFPIHYGAVINFEKFKDLIDSLGGIDLTVDTSFVDHTYPVQGKENDSCNGDPNFGCRYKTISFRKGPAHMSGAEALTFVRSRHAEGIEGSDFSRGIRQEKVLQAVTNQVLRQVKTFDPKTIAKVYGALNEAIDRDITNQEIASLILYIGLHGRPKTTLTHIPQDFFTVPDYSLYEGKYVLIPSSSSFDDIHTYIHCFSLDIRGSTCQKPRREMQ